MTVSSDRTELECDLKAAVDLLHRGKQELSEANEAARRSDALLCAVTERKRMEEAMIAAKAAAAAANAAKSQFLANISHELRTPMNAILGMIDLALPRAATPAVHDCLQTAKDSASLLLTLLDDLLDAAQLELGKLELDAAPFSLRKLLSQIARSLGLRASEKGLRLECRAAEDAPDALRGDRARLQQILLNLAGNAIKFTERGAVEVDVRTVKEDEGLEMRVEGSGMRGKRLEMRGAHPAISHPLSLILHPSSLSPAPSAVLQFSVRDTGIGILPEAQKELFEPFRQADVSMSRRFGGSGLGLSIAKSLVEMMGGRICVESEPGKGSTFHFTVRLPLTEEAPADSDAPAEMAAAACRPLRVLLAEDNPANQKLVDYILAGRGHRLEVAGEGEEAVYLSERNVYDAILMDIQMPCMDGLAATAAIRRREAETAARRVPIIAMTAHAMPSDRQRCLEAGMDAYLPKPVNAQELIRLVERLGGGCACVAASDASVASIAQNEEATPEVAAVFDPRLALERCFDSEKMVRNMAETFFTDCESVLPELRAALVKGDLARLGELGHRLKGTIAYLGAQAAADAAGRLEQFSPVYAEDAVAALERHCTALQAALRTHRFF